MRVIIEFCDEEACEILAMGEQIMANLDALKAAVIANTDATNRAVTAIGSGGTATDQLAVDAITSDVSKNNDALNAALGGTSTPPVNLSASPVAAPVVPGTVAL